MMPFAEEFVILGRAVTGQDGDGNDTYGEVETTVKGAYAPAGSTENVQGQLQVITNDTLYLNDGECVPDAQDKMRVRGIVRDVVGRPAVFKNPFTGWQPGAVVRLEDVTG